MLLPIVAVVVVLAFAFATTTPTARMPEAAMPVALALWPVVFLARIVTLPVDSETLSPIVAETSEVLEATDAVAWRPRNTPPEAPVALV